MTKETLEATEQTHTPSYGGYSLPKGVPDPRERAQRANGPTPLEPVGPVVGETLLKGATTLGNQVAPDLPSTQELNEMAETLPTDPRLLVAGQVPTTNAEELFKRIGDKLTISGSPQLPSSVTASQGFVEIIESSSIIKTNLARPAEEGKPGKCDLRVVVSAMTLDAAKMMAASHQVNVHATPTANGRPALPGVLEAIRDAKSFEDLEPFLPPDRFAGFLLEGEQLLLLKGSISFGMGLQYLEDPKFWSNLGNKEAVEKSLNEIFKGGLASWGVDIPGGASTLELSKLAVNAWTLYRREWGEQVVAYSQDFQDRVAQAVTDFLGPTAILTALTNSLAGNPIGKAISERAARQPRQQRGGRRASRAGGLDAPGAPDESNQYFAEIPNIGKTGPQS